jgi:hypothetical protein
MLFSFKVQQESIYNGSLFLQTTQDMILIFYFYVLMRIMHGPCLQVLRHPFRSVKVNVLCTQKNKKSTCNF